MRYIIKHKEKGLVVHESALAIPSDCTLVCYHVAGSLEVYYERHRDFKMDIATKAYHACLIAQSIGLNARDMRYGAQRSLGSRSKKVSYKQLKLPLDPD